LALYKNSGHHKAASNEQTPQLQVFTILFSHRLYLCRVKSPLLRGSGFFLAVRLPRFVMRQDVFLRLAVHNVDVVIGQVNGFTQSQESWTNT
jgi:hypothetical protein